MQKAAATALSEDRGPGRRSGARGGESPVPPGPFAPQHEAKAALTGGAADARGCQMQDREIVMTSREFSDSRYSFETADCKEKPAWVGEKLVG